MTFNNVSNRPVVNSQPVKYVSSSGHPIEVVEKKPFAEENLQLEVLALRLINNAQRETIQRLEKEITALKGQVTYEN